MMRKLACGFTSFCLVLAGQARPGLALAEAASLRVGGDALIVQAGPAVRLNWTVVQCGASLRSEWRDSGGTLLAWDEVTTNPAGFAGYRLERINTGESYVAERAGAAIRMRMSRAGATSRQSIDAESVVAGAQLVTYSQQHLAELREGRRLRVEYLLVDHGRSIALDLRQVGRAQDGGSLIEISAASILLRPFVPTTRLQFLQNGRFHSMIGQIPPQLGTAQHPQSLVAQMTVHPAPAAVPQSLASNCHIAASY